MQNPFSLKGKTILVTGASSGIGRSIAVECSGMGADLIITGRNEQRLLETYRMLQAGNHSMFLFDLTQHDQYIGLVGNIRPLDGVVHAAGITNNIPFAYMSKDKLEKIMEVNFYAPVEITRLLIKNKKVVNGGSIVFVSSISGIYTSTVALSAYSASKAALNGFSKSLALELAQKNIRVNNINPGIVETNIFSSGAITEDQLNHEKDKYPTKRFGRPEEIAFGAIYLLSDASSWVTGTNLLIDGGFTLQ